LADGMEAHPEHRASHGPSRLVFVWVALVVLTGVTYMTWRSGLPEPWHILVALGIAVAKSALVALFFMELWEHRGPSRLVFATSLILVALLIGLVVADNVTRFPLANPPHQGTLEMTPPLAESAQGSPGLAPVR
jgi:cytochrome c oxidase subunit IV